MAAKIAEIVTVVLLVVAALLVDRIKPDRP
jgi:hypothetical protein